jgi:hypothetical protein
LLGQQIDLVHFVNSDERKYEWDGKQRTVKMIARTEYFQGKFGLYNPADAWVLTRLQTRLVVQESVINFDNYDKVYEFLNTGRDVMDWVYNNDGLVVGFGRTPDRQQINIDLWQIKVAGVKPTSLKGSRDRAIHLYSR